MFMDTKTGSPQEQPRLKKGIVKAISEHPLFSLVCGLATLFGTTFGIWGYCVSVTKPNLTYYISPIRTPIVQKGNLENFSVTFKGMPIESDLSAATIQVWNQGKAPIVILRVKITHLFAGSKSPIPETLVS